ncbi:MAG: nucleotidyl transferase, partial [Actinomycetota bacterium]
YSLSVTYAFDGPQLLGTGGALRRGLTQLGEIFWVTYGDTLLTVPMKEVEESYRASGLRALMTVLHNRDRWDRSNVAVAAGMVVEYRKGSALGTFEHIDYGMSILPIAAFEAFPPDRAFDLEEVLSGLVAARELAAFEVQERFYEIGTPESYAETVAFFSTTMR